MAGQVHFRENVRLVGADGLDARQGSSAISVRMAPLTIRLKMPYFRSFSSMWGGQSAVFEMSVASSAAPCRGRSLHLSRRPEEDPRPRQRGHGLGRRSRQWQRRAGEGASATGVWGLVVLDMSMPGRNGLELIKLMKAERPRLPILVFSMHQEEQYAVRAIRAGASGYVPRRMTATCCCRPCAGWRRVALCQRPGFRSSCGFLLQHRPRQRQR